MPTVVSATLRREVSERAQRRCEYCLLPETFALHRHEPDHVVPVQHGGETDLANLALACLRCNRYKGPNIGSYDPETGFLTPFYHPRRQQWHEHFQLVGAMIKPLTPEGRVTVLVLRMNDDERMQERAVLVTAGVYP